MNNCDCDKCTCDTEKECQDKNCKCTDNSKTVKCVCIAASELRD